MPKPTNFIREYLEGLSDEKLTAICRRGGIPESEIPPLRKAGPFECEPGLWPAKRAARRRKNKGE
jgi:hypothetical protein